MSTRYTNRVLLAIIVVLLITNIMMVVFFIFPPQKPGREVPRNHSDSSAMAATLRDSVGFTPEQVARYMELRANERPLLKGYFSEMRSVKGRFYKLATSHESDSTAFLLADSIGMVQKKIDIHMRDYFIKMRDICTPGQLPAFDSVISRTVNRMIGRSGSRNKNTSDTKTDKKTE